MKIESNHHYIVIPVNENLEKTSSLILSRNGEDVYRLDIRLDPTRPTFFAYIDISRFMGEKLSLSVTPDIPFTVEYADSLDEKALYSADNRPTVHFTTPSGWINDPNGLCEYRGEYHLFYQYNPADTVWGNMHWGHAVSRDLILWENLPIAIYPDMNGTIYSGSAIIDSKNASGLKEGENDPILFFYTYNIPGRTQNLAYSTDGGKTFRLYEKNPILQQVDGYKYNRDPKVIFCPEIDKYLMALYLAEDKYAFFKSENLLEWEEFFRISLPGDNECPDIYRLPLEGEYYYVFKGAHSVVLIGKITEEGFIPVEETYQFQNGGIFSYASQSFESNGRRIDIAWHQKVTVPGAEFSGQMSIPTECKLTRKAGKIRLTQYPVEELRGIYGEATEVNNLTLGEKEAFSCEGKAFDLTVSAPFTENFTLKLELFGEPAVANAKENTLTFGKFKMPLSLDRDRIDIRIIRDRLSLEVFTDLGASCLAKKSYANYNLPALTVAGSGRIEKLQLTQLQSIHK